jgi:hypothetical protein
MRTRSDGAGGGPACDAWAMPRRRAAETEEWAIASASA